MPSAKASWVTPSLHPNSIPVSGGFISDPSSFSSSVENLFNEFLRHLDANEIGIIAGRGHPRYRPAGPVVIVNAADAFPVSVKSERDIGRLDGAEVHLKHSVAAQDLSKYASVMPVTILFIQHLQVHDE